MLPFSNLPETLWILLYVNSQVILDVLQNYFHNKKKLMVKSKYFFVYSQKNVYKVMFVSVVLKEIAGSFSAQKV